MDPGFILDKIHGAGIFSSAEWAEGTPEHSWWTGVKMGERERHPITTYRCSGCGYLESYAVTGMEEP